MDLLAERGVRVVHNPESNMKLASGVAPIPDLLKRGVPVGLGTDGCASNNNLDLFQEMDFAAKVHKVHRLDPTVMPAETVLEMATLGGARVLGMEAEIGSLEVGKKADVIVVDLNRPHLQPVYNVVSHLVYAATGADVRDVIIDGKIVMQNRQLLTLDEERILARMKEIRENIWKRIASLNPDHSRRSPHSRRRDPAFFKGLPTHPSGLGLNQRRTPSKGRFRRPPFPLGPNRHRRTGLSNHARAGQQPYSRPHVAFPRVGGRPPSQNLVRRPHLSRRSESGSPRSSSTGGPFFPAPK